MKILTICGSHRKNGNTARVLSLLAGALSRYDGADVESVFLSDFDIRPCRGCRLCFDLGEHRCPLDDDVLPLRDRILAADGIVLASPVYVNDVSGTMKTFIDRLAFVCHRPAFAGIPAVVIATTAGSPCTHAIRTMQTAHISWGGAVIASTGFVTGAITSREEIGSRHGGKIERLGRRLASAVSSRRWERPSFASLLVFRVQQKSWKRYAREETEESLDARYWREHGWFDKRTTFYIPHRAPRLRVALARAAGSVLADIFG